jgi:hypothetical protein
MMKMSDMFPGTLPIDRTDVEMFGREAREAAAHAVNCHDDLVEALERIADLTPRAANAGGADDLHHSVKAIARAALAKAEV